MDAVTPILPLFQKRNALNKKMRALNRLAIVRYDEALTALREKLLKMNWVPIKSNEFCGQYEIGNDFLSLLVGIKAIDQSESAGRGGMRHYKLRSKLFDITGEHVALYRRGMNVDSNIQNEAENDLAHKNEVEECKTTIAQLRSQLQSATAERIRALNLNVLSDEIYGINRDKGFYDEVQSLSHYMMLVVTEVSEAVEADRTGKWVEVDIRLFMESIKNLTDSQKIEHFNNLIKHRVEDEMADIILRILSFCALKSIDIDAHVRAKLNYNALTGKNGKAY
ncbi:hypothetical protein GCM10027347_44530 [Larkinella harenae]